MKKNISLIAIIFLITSIIFSAGCTTDIVEEKKPSPEETLKAYIDAVNTQNKTKLYNLFCSEFQEQNPRIDFYNQQFSTPQDYGQIVEHYDYFEEIDGNNAHIKVTLVAKYNEIYVEKFGMKEYTEDTTEGDMVFEDGKWRLCG